MAPGRGYGMQKSSLGIIVYIFPTSRVSAAVNRLTIGFIFQNS
jgi:hypothetical protein